MINYGLPAVWIPLGSKLAADQEWRAQKLSGEGLGWMAERLDSDALCEAIRRMLEVKTRQEMKERMLAQPAPLGAQKGAEIICNWIRS